jgi:superoxide dismutase, Fe-Mn family
MPLTSITCPPLPYALNALTPNISEETLNFHYNKHHKTYVTKLNGLLPSLPTSVDATDLITLIKTSNGGIFNNAAQVWNHAFYWDCLSPTLNQQPDDPLQQKIKEQFGSLEAFRQAFDQKASTLFGSGWCWLVLQPNQSLAIKQTSNAENPLTTEDKPLLCCDVWEHAYYIDTRNSRPDYLKNFWNLVNWAFVSELYSGSELPNYTIPGE